MFKLKLGAALGFVAGWAIGSGRTVRFWDSLQQSVTRLVVNHPITGASGRGLDADRTTVEHEREVSGIRTAI
jgi:hypothetical protein